MATNSQMDVHQLSDTAFIINSGERAYSLSMGGHAAADALVFDSSRRSNWEYSASCVMGKKIVPYGPNNEMPILIRNLMSDNNLAPGILQRQRGLLYGQGAFLYRNVIENGKIRREYVEDKTISNWLESWDAARFIERAVVDFLHMNSFFALHFLERGNRIGVAPKIAKLKFVPTTNARLEWVDSRDIDDVKSIYVGDFENDCRPTGIRTYPVFDPMNPGRHAVSASYNYAYSFGRNLYSTPAFMGAVRWILRGSDIPTIFKYVTDNGLNLAYHIHSPAMYWQDKEAKIRNIFPLETDSEISARLTKIKEDVMRSITEVLSGKTNAGKFFESIDFYDENKNICSWKIEAVDQKIKDFVDAQLKIGEAANSAITSGMQLHPSLTNIMVNGKLASGSEMLYALKIYLLSDTRIPEIIILDPINQALRINFNTDLRLGFYHKDIMSEDEVTPNDRVKNNEE